MRLIPLRRRDRSIRAFAIVDDADYDYLAQWNWFLYVGKRDDKYVTGYRRGGKLEYVYMHRVIMGITDPSVEIDHKNGSGLDNRRRNLRIATHQQNQQNRQYGFGSSRHRGVHWDKARRKWQAQVRLDGRNFHLGRFDSEQAAADAVGEFRKEHMPYSEMDHMVFTAARHNPEA